MTDEAKSTEVVTPPPPQKSVVAAKDDEDVTNLSPKDIKHRALYKSTLSELETLKANNDKTKRDFEERLKVLTQEKETANRARIDSEVKALAVSEGLSDLDLLQLVDTKSLTISENGEIVGAKEAIAEFKSKKPAFFSQPKKTNSSTNAQMPGDAKIQGASAYDLPAADWKSIMRQAQTTSM